MKLIRLALASLLTFYCQALAIPSTSQKDDEKSSFTMLHDSSLRPSEEHLQGVRKLQPPRKSLAEIIAQNFVLQSLEAFLGIADMVEELSGDGPFMMLTPWDRGFDELQTDLVDKLVNPSWGAHLQNLLNYHIFHGSLSVQDLAETQVVTMDNGETVEMKKRAGTMSRVRVNDVLVLAVYDATNGYAYMLESVLMPSWVYRTLLDLAIDNFSTLTSLVVRAGAESILSDPQASLTVFAPDDAAFAKLCPDTITFLEENEDLLVDTLLYHMVPDGPLPSMLLSTAVLSTLQGEEIELIVGSPIVVRGKTNKASVTLPDQLANNGLVHVIDTVLLLEEAPSCDVPQEQFQDEDDWQRGTPINVLVTEQLQLSEEAEPFNFIWIAASARGTVIKLDTITGDILGEYKSGPDSLNLGNPSRTTVDSDGSVWVANRNHVPGSVVHIGLVENGQCEDRNGNGVIDTSTGLGDILDWTDESGTRSVATAADECIISITRVSSTGTRHLSLDANNNLWVGGFNVRSWDLIQGGSYNAAGYGDILKQYGAVGYGGYGGLIDSNEILWSARNLLRWDVSLPLEGPNGDAPGFDIGPVIDGRNWAGDASRDTYGLCLDSMGNVWATSLSGNSIAKYSPEGIFLGAFPHGSGNAQGCVVGLDDDVWVAQSLWGSSVGHIQNDGTFVGTVAVGSGPTGVAVDGKGKIWSANINGNSVSRIDPTLNGGIGGVDLTVDLGGGAGPYNYGDMTGSTLSALPNQGSWTFRYDSTNVNQEWGLLDWEDVTPSDSQILVNARSSEDGQTFSAYERASPNVDLSVPNGQYLEIQVLLIRATTGQSPVLRYLSIFHTTGSS